MGITHFRTFHATNDTANISEMHSSPPVLNQCFSLLQQNRPHASRMNSCSLRDLFSTAAPAGLDIDSDWLSLGAKPYSSSFLKRLSRFNLRILIPDCHPRGRFTLQMRHGFMT